MSRLNLDNQSDKKKRHFWRDFLCQGLTLPEANGGQITLPEAKLPEAKLMSRFNLAGGQGGIMNNGMENQLRKDYNLVHQESWTSRSCLYKNNQKYWDLRHCRFEFLRPRRHRNSLNQQHTKF